MGKIRKDSGMQAEQEAKKKQREAFTITELDLGKQAKYNVVILLVLVPK